MRRKRYWLRGGLLGIAVVMLISVVAAAAGGGLIEIWSGLVLGIFGAAPLGMIGGGLIDISRHRVTPRRHPAAGSHESGRRTVAELVERAGSPIDVWQVLAANCHDSVRRAGEAIALAPESAATDWLRQLHARMVAELPKVDTLASLARTDFAHEAATPSAGAREHPLHAELTTAAAEFEAGRRRIADIVAQLVGQPDLGQVAIELHALEIELPILADPDLG